MVYIAIECWLIGLTIMCQILLQLYIFNFGIGKLVFQTIFHTFFSSIITTESCILTVLMLNLWPSFNTNSICLILKADLQKKTSFHNLLCMNEKSFLAEYLPLISTIIRWWNAQKFCETILNELKRFWQNFCSKINL